ncbi:hypothetical protein GCM10009713_32250 [Brevibacterium celere]
MTWRACRRAETGDDDAAAIVPSCVEGDPVAWRQVCDRIKILSSDPESLIPIRIPFEAED